MVTSARYVGWFIALIGALMIVVSGSFLLFGGPEFTFNGEPVRSPTQAYRALAAAIAVFGFGSAIGVALRTKLLNSFPAIRPTVQWLEAPPTDDPRDHKRTYLAAALLGIPTIAFAGTSDVGSRALLIAAIPVLCIVGWAMMWAIGGVQLFNPFCHLAPWFLTFGARFFHFFFLLGAGLSIFYLPFSHAQQIEIGLSRHLEREQRSLLRRFFDRGHRI